MPLIGARAKELRERLGKTVEEIASAVGVGENTIWRWETGKTQPSGARVSLLADALKSSVDYLLGNTDDPTPSRKIKADLNDKEYRLIDAWRSGDLQKVMRLLGGLDD